VVVLWLVCCCCHPSVITIYDRIMFGLLLLSSVSKHTVDVIRLDLSLLSSFSKHNMWSYYGLICCCCRPLVNTTCGRIMVGFVVVVVRQ
jgi:hypothetical protein